jgi:hypothetical protein
MFFLLSFVFFFKIREQEGRTDSAKRRGRGEVAQIMYTHVSTCKNDKIKKKKKNYIQPLLVSYWSSPTLILFHNLVLHPHPLRFALTWRQVLLPILRHRGSTARKRHFNSKYFIQEA